MQSLILYENGLPVHKTTHYLMGSTVGPHPYPEIVATFQSVIGREIKEQILEKEGRLPDTIVACGSGGSNALGAFRPFINEKDVKLVFVEGGGESLEADNSAAAFKIGKPGISTWRRNAGSARRKRADKAVKNTSRRTQLSWKRTRNIVSS